MITREQVELALGDDNKSPYKIKNVDHSITAIWLLREKIPYEVCKSIIAGAEHDSIYLCDVEKALPYLSEADLEVLADCNLCVDEDNDCLFMFV
jgi:hypothetical protein